MEERNRVFRVMKRLQLPFWHPVCCTQLFYKVPSALLAVLFQMIFWQSCFRCEVVRTACCCTTVECHDECAPFQSDCATEVRLKTDPSQQHADLWLICACQGLLDTTKARDGLQRVPLMAGIGAATFVNDLTREEIAVAAKQLHLFAEAASGAVASNIVAARPASLDLVLAT